MKWFDSYFDFFSPQNSKYLLTVIEELMSSTPSFEALPYTQSVVEKIRPELLIPIENEFVNLCAQRAISYPKERIEILIQKLEDFLNKDLIKSGFNSELAEKILMLGESRRDNNSERRKELDKEIYYTLNPDEK